MSPATYDPWLFLQYRSLAGGREQRAETGSAPALEAAEKRTEDGGFRKTSKLRGSVAPEVLFIKRCLDWLRPGGRMGIVLPDGILGNPAAEYIHWWILRRAWVLASVDLPVETFIRTFNDGIAVPDRVHRTQRNMNPGS